ncbi:MAG: SMP-30/gluconolactonase/LRE family protein [Acidobacteria bacterium]|nr:SMP-30/gluconolactonase/LRE family protein [Acidobacteriota bacterium]
MRPWGSALLVVTAWGQDFSQVRLEKATGGYRFTEGPVWSRDGNFLLFSDVPSNRILQIGVDGTGVARDKSNGASGNAFDAQGRLYTCETSGRRVIRMDKKGTVEVLASAYQGKKLNAPNDIVVRKDGHVYFTDPAFGSQTASRELDFHGVFHIPPKGEMEVIARPNGRPNGIALSPNGRVLYVSNSDERNVRAYDLDNKGSASGEREVVTGIEGVPGGIKTDEKGNLYVTAKELYVYSPQGKLIHTIEMPETPSNLAFGGGDWMTAFITARTSVYRTVLPVKGAVQH